jgi:hypothetical protein
MKMNTFLRSLALTLIAIGTLVAAGDAFPAAGQDSSTPTGSASAQKPGEEPAAAPTPQPVPKASPTPSPTPTADVEEQLEEFVPSEEIRADQAVAFPVDI